MKFCSNCGEALADEITVCPKCGNAVASVEATKTAEEVTAAENNEAAPAPAAEPAQAPVNPAPQPVYQNQGGYQGGFQGAYQQAPVYYKDPADHTDEMDAKDIQENKIFAVSVYVFGWLGILLALLAAKESRFVNFHIKEMLRLLIVEVLLGIVTAVLFWTLIVPVLGGICAIALFIFRIVGFCNCCSGKAKDIPFVHTLKFLA